MTLECPQDAGGNRGNQASTMARRAMSAIKVCRMGDIRWRTGLVWHGKRGVLQRIERSTFVGDA